MKKHLKILSVLVASVMIFTACSSTSTSSSKTVAKVNGENISYDEYLKKLAVFKLQLDMQFGQDFWTEKMPNSEQTLLEQFKTEILDKVIEDKIISQEAKKQKVKADEKKVKEYVEQSKNRINNSDILKKYYADNKIDDAFINLITVEDLTKIALEEKYMADNPITQEDIDKHYSEHKADYSNEQVRASHIILLTTENGQEMTAEKKAEVKKQIDEIYGKIELGESFEELAKKYSQDGSKEAGGDLGYFSKGAMVKAFEDVVYSMKVGEISEPFETEFGYHIVKLTDRQDNTTDEAQVKEYIKVELESGNFTKFVDSLKQSAKIEKYEDLIKEAEKDIKPADYSNLNQNKAPVEEEKENKEQTQEKK